MNPTWGNRLDLDPPPGEWAASQRRLIESEARLAHQLHQIRMQMIELEHRTWFILVSIPVSAVLLGIVVIGVMSG